MHNNCSMPEKSAKCGKFFKFNGPLFFMRGGEASGFTCTHGLYISLEGCCTKLADLVIKLAGFCSNMADFGQKLAGLLIEINGGKFQKTSKNLKAIVKNSNVHLIICRPVILHHIDIVS